MRRLPCKIVQVDEIWTELRDPDGYVVRLWDEKSMKSKEWDPSSKNWRAAAES